MKITSYPLQTAIELACAAYRANNGYLSESKMFEIVSDERVGRFTNKELMLVAMGAIDPKKYEEMPNKPVLLCTNLEDQELANKMQKHFKKLLFSAIDGEDQFKSDLFAILNHPEVPINKLGFVACLPKTYFRDRYDVSAKSAEAGYLGNIGDVIVDADCEIIKSIKSKNFNAFNNEAIINEKLTSWMGKECTLGPAVMLTGTVKDHTTHWKFQTDVTRLNYVKVFQ